MKTNEKPYTLGLGLCVWLLTASVAQAFYNPQTGRRLNRDPIEEAGGNNLCAACHNDLLGRIDPRGQIQFSFHPKRYCTLFVYLHWQVRFQDDGTGPWTEGEKTDWQKRAADMVNDYYSYQQPYRCFCKCGECPHGVNVVLTLTFTASWWAADYSVTVLHTTDHRSSAGPLWRAELDRGDLDPTDKGGPEPQVPILHEVGHMLGLGHPGGWSNDPSSYDADPGSLMGLGNTLRIGDFDKAFCKHIKSECSPWTAKLPVP
jgi:hypothetical protein